MISTDLHDGRIPCPYEFPTSSGVAIKIGKTRDDTFYEEQ